MTTAVTVRTVDWPVEVTFTDDLGVSYTRTKNRVEPNSESTFHIWDSRSIHFKELPRGE